MRRSPRAFIAWALAGIAAIVTLRVVYADMQTLHRRAQSLGADVPVLLATRDVPVGAVLARGDLRVVSRPASTVAPDALRNEGDAVGRVVGSAVLHGDAVRGAHLAPAERRGIDGIIPAGRRAVHVVLGDGFRPPLGSVVDVLAAFDAGTDTPASGEAVLAARGALVIAVDTTDAADGSGPGAASGVTLLVAEREAASVASAALAGRVALALGPPEAACCTSQELSAAGSSAP